MSTKMYLKSGSTKLVIPVLPEKIEITDSANPNSVTVGDIGEILLKQGRKAQTISFSSFFPAKAFRGSTSSIKSPSYYVKLIEKWIENKSTVSFVLTRDSTKFLSVSLKTLIKSFKYSEEGGDEGTIQYSLSLTEYRAVTVNQIKVSKTSSSATKTKSRTSSKTTSKTYTVKSGDWLCKIAKSQLGNSSRWKEIYNLNKSVIESAAKSHGYSSSSTGHWIFPGTVLQLPS